MKENETSITLKCGGVECKITVDDPLVHLEDIIDNLIKPALLGVGYQQQTVDQYFVKDECL